MSSYAETRSEPTGTRRHLSARQADTVARLASAAMEELRDTGWTGLTVRNVARRAGVAPATAYTYFASKEHLVTEVFWQRVRELDRPPAAGSPDPSVRVTEALGPVAEMVAAEPELAAACTVALLSEDSEVKRLRDEIGKHWSDLVRGAVGSDASDAQVLTIEAAFSGLMLRAGMGHMPYGALPAHISEVAEVTFSTQRTAGSRPGVDR
jgi:AcrR family transcriptional regulator